MDVDKLRPGTVPLAPETVLWFEFLLDPTLLEKHLSQPNPDPSPIDLMIKFLGIDRKEEIVTIDDDVEERESSLAKKNTKRSIAIKLLTLKVFAHLNWDIDVLESKLPLPMQVSLLLDLLFIALEDTMNVSAHINLDFKTLDHQAIFAISLYHRWVLKAFMSHSVINRQDRAVFVPIPGLQDATLLGPNQKDQIYSQLDTQVMDSLQIMVKLTEDVKKFVLPTFHSFIHLTEATKNISTKWETGEDISLEEFKCQVHFELGCFNVFREDYNIAKHHFSECYKFYTCNWSKVDSKFCMIPQAELEGYCRACDVKTMSPVEMTSIVEKFKHSIHNHYTGIIQILQADNIRQQIPIVDREMLEVEILVAVSSATFTVAKDLVLKVKILNTLRRATSSCMGSYEFLRCLRNSGDKGMEFFIMSLQTLVRELNPKKVDNVKYFLVDLMMKDLNSASIDLCNLVLKNVVLKVLFNSNEVANLHDKMGLTTVHIPSPNVPEISLNLIARRPNLEIINIQQQLIQTYNCDTIKSLLQKLTTKDITKTWSRFNNKWDLPIPLQSVVTSLPKGFVQDIVYILLAKANELGTIKEFPKAISLLQTAAQEAKESTAINAISLYKLTKLIDWEILLLQIYQYLDEYPRNNFEPSELAAACKACLSASQAGDSVIPRLEVMENCALALLNLGEWETLISMDKRWVYLELAGAIAGACQDINKFKGSKKLSRDAWDLILPVFGPSLSSKRNNPGATASPTGSHLSNNSLVNFLTRLREPSCLLVVVSLLARLHNVLKDEPNLEVNCQYIGLWPAVVSNSNSYNSRCVAEVLTQVILQALKFMPTHFQFLKVLGDLNYVIGEWASALRHYLEAAAVASDLFSQQLPKHVLDDFVLKRMIKCCSQLHCHTQAAVLCQFLDEVDYATAFKCLSETKTSHCSDAMDAYYSCFWDLTILEYLVNMHSKRGETHRKQQVMKIIGLLELNSNNNEEIQREAANIRRGQFLRALTNQYSIASNMNILV